MVYEIKNLLFHVFMVLFLSSCGSNTKENEETIIESGTPVSVISPGRIGLTETIQLNATSSFLLKTPVKSLVNGYLKNVVIKEGDFVNKGEVLMNVITKEAQSLGNALSSLDTLIHFKDDIAISAPGSGYISLLNFQSGDYVQDGEQIALISDAKSFAFILQLPYELTPLVKTNRNIKLILPDSSILQGILEKPMPTVDAAAQTQNYLISVNTSRLIPENLLVKVIFVKSSKQNVQTLPKEAILTDETQNNFWVMKLLNDTTAIKIIVKKGIETNENVEILEPLFSGNDQILVSGNYGLPDTAKIHVVK
jgi:biotin carboxyl carrier protein